MLYNIPPIIKTAVMQIVHIHLTASVEVPFHSQHLFRVSLGPLFHQLSDNLATGQLRHLIDKCDAAHKPFMLGHARGGPVLDVFGRYFAL
jgi:hypothetical protein